MILATHYYSDEWQAILDSPLDEAWLITLAVCSDLDEDQHEELLHAIVERSFDLDELKQSIISTFRDGERLAAIQRVDAARIKLEEAINSILNRREHRPHRPIKRGAEQDEALLQIIRSLGYDQFNLQKTRGIAGQKAKIKKELLEKRRDIFGSEATVDNCWRRLRKSHQIKYSDEKTTQSISDT